MSTWRPLGADPGEGPRPLRRSLDGLARSLGGAETGVLQAVFSRWAELVGPAVAGHTTPVSLRQGVLVVAVDQPVWATQLRFLEADILSALAEAAGGKVADRLEVRVRPGKSPQRPR